MRRDERAGMAPRFIGPNATYAISRRIEGRRFLLRPDSILTALFIWVLGITAEQFGVIVHVATVMSTHFHLVVTVPNENVSEFMHRLDMRLARAIQVLRRFVSGVVWEPGTLSIIELETTQAVIEQIVYAITNPVKAGLVWSHHEWPGLTARVEDIGHRVFTAPRPDFYFTGEWWPQTASFTLVLPECLSVLGEEETHALLRAELERQEAEARAEVKENGWNVLGATAAKNISPYRCAKSWRDLGKLNPTIAAGRGQKEARLAAIARIQTFRQEHALAKRRWMAGDRDVEFPAGTYWMRVHHRAKTAAFA